MSIKYQNIEFMVIKSNINGDEILLFYKDSKYFFIIKLYQMKKYIKSKKIENFIL